MGYFDSIFFIVLLFQSKLLHLPILSAKDTLMPGDELTDTSTLVSSNGIYTLKFYTVSPSGTDFTYLGIWGIHIQSSIILWTANRDQPIDGMDAILSMDASSGTVRVKNRSGATLFNVSDDKVGLGNNKNNTRAKLLNSGNFIVYDMVTNRTIWESFDHPTDTIYPGMKLGYNLTANKKWELTSAANDQVPTSGAFTMRLKQYQNTPQLLIYRHGDLYWASGPWNDTTRSFQWVYYYHVFELTYDPSGMYFIFPMKTWNKERILQLSPMGNIPPDNMVSAFLTYPDFCSGYESEYESEGFAREGCVVELPHCRAAALTSANVVYRWIHHGEGSYSHIGPNDTIDDNSSISLGDCLDRCWNNCGCVATSTYNDNGTGCIYATMYNPGGLKDVQRTIYQLEISIIQNVHKKPRWKLLSLAIIPVVLVLAFVTIRKHILKGKENRRRDDIIHQLTGSNSFNYGDVLERGIEDAPDVKIFSLKAILAATNNFSSENKLGQGGYGPVYKGELSDARKIAVKRLSKTSGQGIPQFKSEIILISKLQHTNLVRLYGCCIHQEERMLIYEYMPNKSLDFFLFDDDKKRKIDWKIRFNIIEGIAQGLFYLHTYSRTRVIHGDLKVNNVLLDENMNPKIADFGLARIFQHDMSVLITNRVAGTYGYMAPEYVIHGTFSTKSDVFSFGVIILEIVSGKKNTSFHNLLRCAWELWKREATLDLKDEALRESFDVNQLLRAIHVGILCVQEHANDRPIMSQVISMLNSEIANLPHPKKPLFFMHPEEVETSRSTEQSFGDNIQGSINGLTITTMEAR